MVEVIFFDFLKIFCSLGEKQKRAFFTQFINEIIGCPSYRLYDPEQDTLKLVIANPNMAESFIDDLKKYAPKLEARIE